MTFSNTPDLRVSVGSVTLKNPVMPASGTFEENLSAIMDFNRPGALVIKTFTRDERHGNPMPRVVERPGCMLNAIGIPSKGPKHFFEKTLPFYAQFTTPLVVSISAPTVEEFALLAAEVSVPGVAVIEANISCPNIEEDGKAFAQQASSTALVVKKLRAATHLPLWLKLTPNAGDMPAVAKAAEDNGADAVVISNTILAMAIDVNTFRPCLGNIMGGLSGPAIKPIVLRHVYQCAKAVSIPIIGCGGITTAEDAVEYMLAGACAVQVGTATFIQPSSIVTILDGLAEYCSKKGIERIADLTGAVIIDQENR